MRNTNPEPIKCAVCQRTGPASLFMQGGEFVNWVEARGGTYVVCNEHIHTVAVQEPHLAPWEYRLRSPIFSADPTLRDLERRIERLEEDRGRS